MSVSVRKGSSMKKNDVIRAILKERLHCAPMVTNAKSFAPTNIALCKYWGKRNQELNLPVTSSLSISLGNKGAEVEINIDDQDSIILNQQPVDLSSGFAKRLIEFLNLFRNDGLPHLSIQIQSNIPIAAGLASSACGFASLIQALDQLYGWQLRSHELSILARLGSGSASRSLWQGFVEWHAGTKEDGMDSHGELISNHWPDLCIGLLVVSDKAKSIGSREAMQRTVTTSPLYSVWPNKVSKDLLFLKQAIATQDFKLLGETAESNAMTMHATMLSAWPPISYCLPETIITMHKIWQLRREGLQCYFTQDAGPNLKLLFLKQETAVIRQHFTEIEVVEPF